MSVEQPSKLWNRDFSILWAGLIQSYLGDAFLEIGLLWLVLELTGSPVAAGAILALEGIPKLLGPLAGVIIDRTSKRLVLIMADLVRGMILVLVYGLYVLGLLAIWQLYILVVVLGAMTIFYGPALRVMLPTLVPDSALPGANSAIQGGQQVAMIVGASLAGVMLALIGTPAALLLDGLSFLIAALALWLVHFPPGLLRSSRLSAGAVWHDMIGGLRFIFFTTQVLMLTALAFFINLVLSPVNVIFPFFSNTVLGQGVEGFGFLAASIAVGLLVGNLAAGIIGDRLPYTWSILLGLLGMTLALIGLSFAQTLLVALIITAMLGFMTPFIQIPLVSRLQRAVPQNYQGRVFATMGTLISLSTPLAAALAGQALAALPIPLIFRVAAVGTLVVACIWFVVSLRQQPEPGGQTGSVETTR
ncbi:MAG TPA: MFS transporter [Herpetosiphonaceae bacterium]